MPTEISYTHARANLAALCEEAISTREPIIIHRPGGEDVALVAADELRGLMETAHLLRSPKNAERLLKRAGTGSEREPSIGDRGQPSAGARPWRNAVTRRRIRAGTGSPRGRVSTGVPRGSSLVDRKRATSRPPLTGTRRGYAA